MLLPQLTDFLNGDPFMKALNVNETEIHKIVFPGNWMSMISNTEKVSEDIKSMIMQTEDLKAATSIIYATNLIEIKDCNNTNFFIKLKAGIVVNMRFSEKNQMCNFDFERTTLQACHFSLDLAFVERLSTEYLNIVNSQSSLSFNKYLIHNKLSTLNLINLQSLKEALEWLMAQQIQMYKKPSIQYLKAAS